MSDPITITINRTTPSGNKSTFGNRWAYMKERNIWYSLMRAALKPKEKPTHRVRVKIISFRVSICDRINFASGCKPLLDGLVRLGYLHDDSELWVDDHYEQRKAPRKSACTIIHIHNP